MHSSGWTESRSDIVRLHLLDWAANAKGERPLAEFSGAPFSVEDINGDLQDVAAIARALEGEGLVHLHRSLAGINSLSLTASGENDVRARQERRRNKGLRRQACLEALLSWIGRCEDEGVVAPLIDRMVLTASPYAYFEGEPLDQQEIEAASRQLLDRGLITGLASWGGGVSRPSLTTMGREVVDYHDGSLRRHYEATQQAAPTFISHFGSVSGGQIAVGQQITQTQNVQAPVAPEILELLDRLRTAVLHLPDGDREVGLAFVDAIQASGPDDVSRGLAQNSLPWQREWATLPSPRRPPPSSRAGSIDQSLPMSRLAHREVAGAVTPARTLSANHPPSSRRP